MRTRFIAGIRDNLRTASLAAGSSGSPKMSWLILFVTARCNLLCKHCFYTDEIQTAAARRELSCTEYDNLARRSGTLLNLNVTGGEPFIRTDVSRIIRSFREHTRVPFCGITTNGLLKDRILETVEDICSQPGPFYLKLGVSLDGFEEEHDFTRGRRGLFQQTVKTIEALESLRIKHPRLMVYVSTTLTKFNKGRIREWIDYVRGNLPVDAHYLGLARGKAMLQESKEVTAFEYKEAFKYLKHRWNSKTSWYNGLSWVNGLMASVNQEVLETGRYWMPCVAGAKMLTITEEGVVKPCEMLEQIGNFPYVMGNVRDFDYDIQRILESASARAIRQGIIEKKCFCTFESACQASLVHQPRQMLRALALKWRRSWTRN